jgi:K+-transporting ATPase ATPase C chain
MHKANESKYVSGTAKGRLARPVIVSSVFFMLITGIGYPLLTTGVAQFMLPGESQGSLIERDGKVIGSAVLGQNFTKPEYFHPRPSATTAPDPADSSRSIEQPYNAALSGASNLGPTSKKLIEQVSGRVRTYREENRLATDAAVPADAVTASASGLDPDISLANARLQAKRVAAARSLPEQQVMALIDRETLPRQLGLLGEPRVNVLSLNLALDALAAKHPSS